MAYAAYSDLTAHTDAAHIVQMSDDNGDGVADVAVIDAALAHADAQINARIGMRYAVPLSPVPVLALQAAATLAVGWLYTHRGMALPESLQQAVNTTLKLLDRIGDGKAGFGEAVQPIPDKSNLDVRSQSQVRVFNRVSMKGF